MPRDELLKLSHLAWTALRVSLRELEHELPGPDAPRAAQVEALLELVRALKMTDRLERELAKLRQLTGQGDVPGWQAVLRARHGKLRVLGIFTGDADQWLDLSELFVDLDILRADSGARARPERIDKGSELFDHRPEALDLARSVDEALVAIGAAEKRGLALVGLPGSGKTTLLLRRFCLAFDAHAQDPTLPRPIYLRCATLQHIGVGRLRPRDLSLAVEVEAAADGFVGAGAALVGSREDRLLVLLDGLDELRSPDDRRLVAEWVSREVELWPNSTWILTCRLAAWGDAERRALGGALEPFHLLNLKDAAIADYVNRWFARMARVEAPFAPEPERPRLLQKAGDDAAALVQNLRFGPEGPDRQRLRRLSGNPLTLTLACLVFRRHGELPRRRGKLYRHFLEVMLRGRYRPGAPPVVEFDDGVRLLAPLAWRMQESGEEDSPKELALGEVLAELDRTRVLVSRFAKTPAEELLRTLTVDSPVLYTADGVNVQFIHLTLQEYLAMEHAKALNLGGELARRAADGRWREPILLAMAEPGLQRAFYDAALRPGVARLEPLLQQCIAEGDADLAAFVFFLGTGRQDWAGLWAELVSFCAGRRSFSALRGALRCAVASALRPPSAEDLRAVLRLFVDGAPPPLREAAGRLTRRDDVAELARRVAGELAVEAGARPLHPAPGQLWRCEALGMELVWVPPGSFWRGAQTSGERSVHPEAFAHESPVHRVTVSEGFWLGRFPVTVAQYQRFVNTGGRAPDSLRNPALSAPSQPITEVDWDDAAAFCAWASGAAGVLVTLPLEAEWEWAARGEDGRKYPWGDAAPTLARAWYGGWGQDPETGEWSPKHGEHRERVYGPAPVGERPEGRGPFGAEEQAGNVWEWCADPYGPYGAEALTLGRVGAEYDMICHLSDKKRRQDDGRLRVVRGGSWFRPAGWLRAASRSRRHPGSRVDGLGFRVVLRPPEPR